MATLASHEVFERIAPDVYRWAYRVLGHHHDALDVVQDVFLRWDRQCTREVPAEPRGWLRRVTLNRVIDFLRKRETVSESKRAVAEPVAVEGRQEESIDRDALRAEIQSALSLLTEQQRAVLVAKVYDRLTFAEIARELGLAVPTVKTHYLRAVRAVRDRLRRRWAEED